MNTRTGEPTAAVMTALLKSLLDFMGEPSLLNDYGSDEVQAVFDFRNIPLTFLNEARTAAGLPLVKISPVEAERLARRGGRPS
jgi:hypothetical protein